MACRITPPVSSVPVTCRDCQTVVERTSNRQIRCPDCKRAHHAARERARRKASPDKISAANKAYRERESERLKALDRERYYRLKTEQPDALREAGRRRGRAFEQRQRQRRIAEGWTPRVPMTAEQKQEHIRKAAVRRYHADPIRCRMAAAVRRTLRGKKLGRSWETLVGYTAEDLRRHLERQFLPKMGWHNIADWHVDHIVPLREFDCSEEDQFKAAWALTNLRPLWELDNCKKGGKRLTLL